MARFVVDSCSSFRIGRSAHVPRHLSDRRTRRRLGLQGRRRVLGDVSESCGSARRRQGRCRGAAHAWPDRGNRVGGRKRALAQRDRQRTRSPRYRREGQQRLTRLFLRQTTLGSPGYTGERNVMKPLKAAAVAVLALLPLAASAAEFPAPKQSEWIARNFKFHTGEVLPELRLAYTTIGEPTDEPVLHGTTGTAANMPTPNIAAYPYGAGQ